ncbi:membrane protein insertase YidC [Miniimonas arenae]|uniref:Membrane protein insertase YidC n=1 Tax=Miniimonas arenae TaxID=676201 RepID=A0A5C5BAL1_9MICO|nr:MULTISPECIES: membrane protein insertase YidC [Miniimonas]TNU73975.1 membrane protein insertase YidC [Miniimonas arenae]
MDWFDTILSPIMWVVAWIMVLAHKAFTFIGMDESGLSWVLSIVVLVIVIRIVLIPLFVRQIRASRAMQIVQPEIQKLQKKYKGKTDPASRQAMQQEMMAIYREAGTNPFASCLPILAQSPIFFALFRVLSSLDEIAAGTQSHIGPLTRELASQAEASTLLGAPLSSWFLMPDATAAVRIVAVILIVAMSVTTFTTQRQLTMKNMPAAALDNPMARQQKMLMYILPLVFAFSGVNFPIGVLIYWTTTNLWSMGQQFYVIRNMPAPGSEAERKYQERMARKAARKGTSSSSDAVTTGAGGTALLEDERPVSGQRQQPKSKARAKKSGAPRPLGTPSSTAPDGVASVPDDVTDAPPPVGTTDSSGRSDSSGSSGSGSVLEDEPPTPGKRTKRKR